MDCHIPFPDIQQTGHPPTTLTRHRALPVSGGGPNPDSRGPHIWLTRGSTLLQAIRLCNPHTVHVGARALCTGKSDQGGRTRRQLRNTRRRSSQAGWHTSPSTSMTPAGALRRGIWMCRFPSCRARTESEDGGHFNPKRRRHRPASPTPNAAQQRRAPLRQYATA